MDPIMSIRSSMKNLTKLCASPFLALLILSGACSKDEVTAKTADASSPVVDNTKEAVKEAAEDTKDAAVKARGAAKESVKDAAEDTKDAAVKARGAAKEAAKDAKATVEDKKVANLGARSPADNTRAAVDNGEAIKTTEAAVDRNASRQVKGGSVTPTHQGNDAADLDTTRRVRRAILADRSLSSEARNVKVITGNGVVLLRGPVKSDAERDNLGARAKKVAGKNRVENRLDVVAAN
jgi:osmotically-inducible protein OsmY